MKIENAQRRALAAIPECRRLTGPEHTQLDAVETHADLAARSGHRDDDFDQGRRAAEPI